MHYTDTEKPASSPKKKAGLAVLIKYTARDKFIFSAVQRAAGQVTAALRPATCPGRQVSVTSTLDIAQCIIAVPSWRNMRFRLILHNIWLA